MLLLTQRLLLAILKQAYRQVPTELRILKRTLAWFNSLYLPEIEQKDWLQCELALAEGLTNAIRHAHRDKPPETPIDLEVTVDDQQIILRIWDAGAPFSLQQYLREQADPMNTHAGGGRGLVILQKIADVLEYNRTEDQRNCLLIVKQYSRANETCDEETC
ncbi:ATP-binding protein [Spirulina subsalsa FACHB-351]|uniref:ATP-binding protein n=1 Tax=Spirulina subsalsa FACHB-351 TaxID=234711 RepID=A0ABT3L3J1_9CYAN|nr:ATP-binding protein [Spirulina subsalsa FACHB-351]